MLKSARMKEFIAMAYVLRYRQENGIDIEEAVDQLREEMNISPLKSSSSSTSTSSRDDDAAVAIKDTNEKPSTEGTIVTKEDLGQKFYVSMVASLDPTGVQMFLHACVYNYVDPASETFGYCIVQIKQQIKKPADLQVVLDCLEKACIKDYGKMDGESAYLHHLCKIYYQLCFDKKIYNEESKESAYALTPYFPPTSESLVITIENVMHSETPKTKVLQMLLNVLNDVIEATFNHLQLDGVNIVDSWLQRLQTQAPGWCRAQLSIWIAVIGQLLNRTLTQGK